MTMMNSPNCQVNFYSYSGLADNSSIMRRSEHKKKMQDLPTNIASKIVGSNLREWGRTVHASSVSHLSRKYRVYDK